MNIMKEGAWPKISVRQALSLCFLSGGQLRTVEDSTHDEFLSFIRQSVNAVEWSHERKAAYVDQLLADADGDLDKYARWFIVLSLVEKKIPLRVVERNGQSRGVSRVPAL